MAWPALLFAQAAIAGTSGAPSDILRQRLLDLCELPPLLGQFAGEGEIAAVIAGLVGCEPAARIGKALR